MLPPELYDLTSLQRDANRYFGFTAKQTLDSAQSLYEKKLLTYPRTDSRYLSGGMEETAGNVIREAFKLFCKEPGHMPEPEPDTSSIINSRKVTDHHAIIPTKVFNKDCMEKIPATEQKILYLVAGKLLCATGEKHIYGTVKAEFSCSGYVFTVSGKNIIHNGWKDFEDIYRGYLGISGSGRHERLEDGDKFPVLSEGQVFENVQANITGHYTTPPKHFTEDTLLSAMERAGASDTVADAGRIGLGTPATRTDIIEKLIKDGFIRRDQKQLIPTEDGIKLVSVLPDTLKSPKLTAEWEKHLHLWQRAKWTGRNLYTGLKQWFQGLCRNIKIPETLKKIFLHLHMKYLESALHVEVM